jgi:Bacterial Ig-like domain/Bacterial Ig domain/RTX calcium-binding nonapeptide repeat (4 copies)
VNGTAQPANANIDVSAAQLASTTFTAGAGTDSVWVRAFDGTAWSAWTNFSITGTNAAPVVTATASNVNDINGQALSASSLFSVTDANNDPITAYQFWDSNAASTSGFWSVNGTAQPANAYIDVSAAQLANTAFQAGVGSDLVWVRAYDGVTYSAWTSFTVTEDTAPVTTASNQTVNRNTVLAASSLFSVSDPDGLATITQYQFYDSTAGSTTGFWSVNGTAQPANANIDVSAAQLASTTFTAGAGTDSVWVRAFDGTAWSAWTNFSITGNNTAPVVTATASNVNDINGQALSASSLFSVTDANNDTITAYQFWDSNAASTSGFWSVNGVAQPANAYIDVSAAQLANTKFQGAVGSDLVWVRAYDGVTYSAWTSFTVTEDTPPVTSATNTTVLGTNGQVLSASSLFSVTDADNDPITAYQFYDSTAGLGFWTVGGVVQPANANIDVTPAQLASATFTIGAGTDLVWVRAYDGTAWGAWTSFTIADPPSAPSITSFSPDTGITGDGITNTATLVLSGTADLGTTVSVYDGANLAGTATVSSSGAWTMTLTGQLANGPHDFTATATDPMGNTGSASTVFTVTIDQPTAPTIVSVGSDTGSSSTDQITSATTLTLSGTADANSTVTLFEGTATLGTATADGSGYWSIVPSATFAEGTHTLTATATDAAGNTSAQGSITVTVDTTAPTPLIASVTATKTGVTLSGTSEVGSPVEVYDGTSLLGTATVSSSGTWSFSATSKQAPTTVVNNFTVTATDKAGNLGSTPGTTEWGTTGNDTLASTAGNDTMYGRAGADTFTFGSTFGHDTIKDFTPSQGDVIQFNQALFANFAAMMLHTTQVGSNTVITGTAAADTVTLANVTATSLQQTNFKFV